MEEVNGALARLAPVLKTVFHQCVRSYKRFVCLFDLILFLPSTIFQLNREGPSWVEPVLKARINVLAQGHKAVTPVILEPAAPRSRVKHSTTLACDSRDLEQA